MRATVTFNGLSESRSVLINTTRRKKLHQLRYDDQRCQKSKFETFTERDELSEGEEEQVQGGCTTCRYSYRSFKKCVFTVSILPYKY